MFAKSGDLTRSTADKHNKNFETHMKVQISIENQKNQVKQFIAPKYVYKDDKRQNTNQYKGSHYYQ